MISVKSHCTSSKCPDQTGVTIHTPRLPIWFHRFRNTEDPEPNWKFDPSDIFIPPNYAAPTVIGSVPI